MPDPAFPRLHIRPDRGWLNDPNGVGRVDGRWHVFFQYNPYSPLHGDICWGHVSSPDLLTWTEEPVALVTRPGKPDATGCWSGCLVDDDGVPTAVYSAVADEPAGAVVLLARSDRTLRAWRQSDTPVAGPAPVPGVTETRDPFVFDFRGRRLAVQGAGDPTGRPRILLYDCADLTRWRLLGPLLTADDPVAARVAPANVWECPNLVEVDGRWVLVVSCWRGGGPADVAALVGDLVAHGAGLRFVPDGGGPFDRGPAYYAPQAVTVGGRVLLWGWSPELGRTPEEVAAAGWAGVLTFPRELAVRDGRVEVRPAAELTGLRRTELDPDGPVTASAFEVLAAGPASLELDGRRVVEVTAGARVLVDGSMVEVFDGPVPGTTRAYPRPGSRWAVRGGPARRWALGLPGR